MGGRAELRGLFKRNGLLIKMLFSILGLICIPLVCLQLLTVLHANREFKRESSTHNQRALASMASAFGGNLEELDNTVYRIRIDKEITKLFTEKVEGYPLLKVAEKIGSYTLDSPLINSVGIYYLEKDMILHNSYRRSVSHVCSDFFAEGSEGEVVLADFLRKTDKRSFFYTGNYPGVRRDCLIIAKAISVGSLSDRDAVVFFVMEEAAFQQWCSVFFPAGESFAVLDPEGSLLMCSGSFSPEKVSERTVKTFLESPEASVELQDGSDMIVYKCRDGVTGLTWLATLEKNTAEEAFTRYTTRTAWMLALAVALMVLLLAVTLYINYKPVFLLMEKHFRAEHKSDDISELELIDSHFFAQDQRLNDQVRLLDTFIMGDLVSGIPVDEMTLERYLPRERYRWFLVLVCPEPLTNGQSREICQQFSIEPSGKLVPTTVPYRSERIFIYAAPESVDCRELRDRLEQAIFRVSGKRCVVRAGNPVGNAGEIQTSYNSALLTETCADEAGIPRSLLAELTQYVTGGNWLGALQTLDKLENTGSSTRRMFYQTKLLNTFLLALEKAGQPLSEGDADKLFAAFDPQQLHCLMRGILEKLRDVEATGGKTSPGELRRRLLEFVDRNYTRSDLCLTAAADYLNTSVYTVSRIFKEVTGYGFKEYITERRLQQAVYLLRESDLPMADVAAACGFESTNYFTAVFRNKHGIPPAKYRREMAGDRLGEI